MADPNSIGCLTMTEKTLSQRLQEPFEAADIEWRAQSCGVSNSNKPWVKAIPYITSRAIQQRLDSIFDVGGWRNEFTTSPDGDGVLCGLSVRIGNEWITKWDGAEKKPINPYVDETKSVLSNATKRAAVQFGIGRYLYNLDEFWAICTLVGSRWESQNNYAEKKDNGTTHHIDWQDPMLPEWALPTFKSEGLIHDMNKATTMIDLKNVFAESYEYARSFNRVELMAEFKSVYDSCKKELMIQAEINADAEFKAAEKWIGEQIANLAHIGSADAIIHLTDKMRLDLAAKSEHQAYDARPLFVMLEKAVKQKLSEIKGETQ